MVPSVVSVYDVTINTNMEKKIVKRAELAHEAKLSNRAVYDAADTGCVNFIISVVDETWYKELEYTDTFYTNVTAQQFLEHLEEHCTGLHVIDSVDIPSVNQTFWEKAEGVTQYINRTEAAQKKSVGTPLPVTGAVIQEIAFTDILASGECPDNMREWQKLAPAEQTWEKWKIKFLLTYAAKLLSDKARDVVGQTFGGQAITQAMPQKV